MRENFRDRVLAHGLHRNAIRQAVRLVWPGLIEGETGLVRMIGLRDYDDMVIRRDLLNAACSNGA